MAGRRQGRRRTGRYDDPRWAPYVPVAKRRAQAEAEAERLTAKGRTLAPVEIAGRAIATSVWGKAWCDNLESYRDFAYRLERGRTYARNGSVLDLQIAPKKVSGLVMGSALYTVTVTIETLAPELWTSIRRDCTGGIDSLVELLRGHLSERVMERLCRQEQGLFPRPAEIKFRCTCPDMAAMCKHVAAVLYGVGARLDAQPELLFVLRGVEATELVQGVDTAVLPLTDARPPADRLLADADLSALFDLDLASPPQPKPEPHPKSKRTPKPKPARAGSPDPPPEPAKPEPAKQAATSVSRRKRNAVWDWSDVEW